MKRLAKLLAVVVAFVTTGCSLQPSRQENVLPAITITEGIKKVDFTVKQPTWLPFTPASKWASAGTMPGGNTKKIDLDYTDGERYVTLTQLRNPNVELFSDNKHPLIEVKLEQGTSAKFMDNGAVRMLTWVDSGIFYQLAGGGKENSDAFTQEELIKIASSLR